MDAVEKQLVVDARSLRGTLAARWATACGAGSVLARVLSDSVDKAAGVEQPPGVEPVLHRPHQRRCRRGGWPQIGRSFFHAGGQRVTTTLPWASPRGLLQ